MMAGVRLFSFACVAAIAVAGCGGSDGTSDASFLEGREMVTVYRQDTPEGFDPDEFVLGLADVFGIEGGHLSRYQGDDDVSVDIGGLAGEDLGSARLDMQTLEWGFTSSTYKSDPSCRFCSPSTVSEDDALARAKELFAATGSLVGEFDWETDKGIRRVRNNDVDVTTITAVRSMEGQPIGLTWVMEFGNGDEVLRANGDAWQPIPIGDAGLLTPTEALAQESAELANDVPVESIDGATLAYATSFNRQTVQGFLIPVYRFPLNADLGLTTDVLAIRRQDRPG